MLLVCCFSGIGASTLLGAGIFSRTVSGIVESQTAAKDYFAVVAAHDWATAHDDRIAALQASAMPTVIQLAWTARERQHGLVTRFDPTGANISTRNGQTTAQVPGTLYYNSEYSEHRDVSLVKEQGIWKLAALP